MSGMQQMLLGGKRAASSWKLQSAWVSNLVNAFTSTVSLSRTPQIGEIIIAMLGFSVNKSLYPISSTISDNTGATGTWVYLTPFNAEGGLLTGVSEEVLRRIAYKVCTSAGSGGVAITCNSSGITAYVTAGLFSVNSPVGLSTLNYQQSGTADTGPKNPTSLTSFIPGYNSLCLLDVWYPNAGTYTKDPNWNTAWQGSGDLGTLATDFVGYTTIGGVNLSPSVSFGSGVCYFVTNCVEFHLP